MVSPPVREIAYCPLRYAQSGRYAAATITRPRAVFCAETVRLLNTNGIKSVERNPSSIKKAPKSVAPVNIQFLYFRLSSMCPAPSSCPTMTEADVTIPLKQMKNRFAIAKPAAIPETTSAPPRVLYSAFETVSETAQKSSEYKIIADFLKSVPNNDSFMYRSLSGLNRKPGLFARLYPINKISSTERAITVAYAAPATSRRGAPK